jgi:hypothetical protein
VRYLIGKGVDLRAASKAVQDAIFAAAYQGAAANLKILVGCRDQRQEPPEGRPLFTRRPGADISQSVIDMLKRRFEGGTALMSAARADCTECVRLLLEHGADAKAATDSGLTALHPAASKGNLPMVNLLLEAGVPVNVADDRGFTPLMQAVNSRTKSPEVVRLLLDCGADAEAKDISGRSVAEWARIGASHEIIRMLPAPAAARAERATVPEAKAGAKEIGVAVQKSVALLAGNGPKFSPKSGCISCHNVSIPTLAINEAHRRGHPVHEASRQMAKQTAGSLALFRDDLLSGYATLAGIATNGSYALISLHGEG